MRKFSLFLIPGLILLSFYSISLFVGFEKDHYFPKPKAFLKINPLSQQTLLYDTDLFSFRYSSSAYLDKIGENNLSILYPDYDMSIVCFFSKTDTILKNYEDLNGYKRFKEEIYMYQSRFAESVAVNEEEDRELYAIIGPKVASSSHFFIVDHNCKYYIRASLDKGDQINYNIIPQNHIMMDEMYQIFSSFVWADSDELDIQ